VLDDPKMREEVKKYSNWQTYPQLYVDKELMGGCDILAEMHKSDQLREFFAKHNCK
jgi:monothiol glutaredoxin